MADLSYTLEAVDSTKALTEEIYVYKILVAVSGESSVSLAVDDIIGVTVIVGEESKAYQKKLTEALILSSTPTELGYIEFDTATTATAGDGFYLKHSA